MSVNSQAEYSKNLQFLSAVDNYNRYIYENIQPFLGESILDVGCGMGNVTKYFSEKKRIIGVDNTLEYLDIFKKKCKNAETMLLDISSPQAEEKLKGLSADTVVMTNVLEHIENDQKVLEKLFKILSPGGNVVLVVPAHKWLFGTVDRYVLHFRRYTPQEIGARLQAAGFKMLRCFQYSALGIPWWFLNGRILRQGKHDERDGPLINKIIPVVRFIDKITFNKIGLSLVVVGKKPAMASVP